MQVPALADAVADEGGPGGAGISKYVAPRALLWFRWGALFTWLTGAAFLAHRGQLDDAFALGTLTDPINQYALTIGIGAWFGSMMPPAPMRMVRVPPATCASATAVAELAMPGML